MRRCFQAERPNVLLAERRDLPIPTREGWLSLAAVLDVYSPGHCGVGHEPNAGRPVTTDALAMAISRRGVPELVHSDRGSTYATSFSWPASSSRSTASDEHEPPGKLLGQRADGKLLPLTEDGACNALRLPE